MIRRPASRFLHDAGHRPAEWVLLGYFSYTASFAFLVGAARGRRAEALSVLLGIVLLPFCARFFGRAGSIARDWIALALVPIAYWQVDWLRIPGIFRAPTERWAAWDASFLDVWKVRAGIERFGWFLPWLLELSYSLLYAIPPLAVALLYLHRRRDRVDGFLFTFLLGTLLCYALLPCFPSDSPRVAFPGTDLPQVATVWRRLNLWVLERYDIGTSVFPSGHVAAAFAAAFAMMQSLPERKWVGRALLVLAGSVALATVYGRYHYAVDSLAALGVSMGAAAAGAACGVASAPRRRGSSVPSQPPAGFDLAARDDLDAGRAEAPQG